MNERRVLEFAAQVLEREGALVEPAGERSIEAVLPETLRRSLERLGMDPGRLRPLPGKLR